MNPNAKVHPLGGGATRATVLPDDAESRKEYPIATGFFDYFPDAICEVSNLSVKGSQQHNPGKSLFWDRSKSDDEPDTLLRHFAQRGTRDKDGKRHSAKVAWRALAMLQKEIEEDQRAEQERIVLRIVADNRRVTDGLSPDDRYTS